MIRVDDLVRFREVVAEPNNEWTPMGVRYYRQMWRELPEYHDLMEAQAMELISALRDRGRWKNRFGALSAMELIGALALKGYI